MNPVVLETLKVLAGIANAERINTGTRRDAEDIIVKLLEAIDKDVDGYRRETSEILKP